VQRVHEARYFTILADETTDAGKKEELSISLRYVINGNVRENFISFTPLGIDTTGAAIAEVILKELKSVGVDTKYMIGQGYDGASCMSGYISGVQACIRKTCPSAIYVHCASHCLNLTLSKSCEVPSIRNCQGVVNEVAVFFNRSAKRNDILKKAILNADVESNRQQLRNLCETRWVERHDAIISFTLLYGPMLEALDECSRTRDKDTAVKAGLLKQLPLNQISLLHSVSLLTF
jgi:hypothetical protein